jgi:hypothetical protein
MSNTNHHPYDSKTQEFLPFLNWRTISGLVLLIIFAVFIGYDFIVQSPKAKLAQNELEIEFKSIESLPSSSLIRYNSSHETSNALVDATYLTDAKPADIFMHYDEQLKQHGWQSFGASEITDWGRNLGGKSAYYCKGEYSAQLQYAGQQANYGWTYAFSVSWGLGDCKAEAKGGWVKQTIPVSLLFMTAGIFLTVNSIDIGKNAWTKDEIEYRKWIRWRNRIKTENSFFSISRKYSLWNDRIFSIVAFIMGLFITWVGAFSLWRNIFGG